MSNGRILRRPPTCVTDRSQPPLYTRQVSNKTTEALAKYLYDLGRSRYSAALMKPTVSTLRKKKLRSYDF